MKIIHLFETCSDLDTNYRILADHIRMITVCLSDQLLPDASHKLRQVLRRALNIQRYQFGIKVDLVKEWQRQVGHFIFNS